MGLIKRLQENVKRYYIRSVIIIKFWSNNNLNISQAGLDFKDPNSKTKFCG